MAAQANAGLQAKKGAASVMRPKSREETPEKGMQQAGKRCCDAKCNDLHGAVQEEFWKKLLMQQVIVFKGSFTKFTPVAVLQQVAQILR